MIQINLMQYIKNMGIKQVTVCEKTGISPDRMSRLMAGTAKLTAVEYEAICKAIGKTPNDFMSVEVVT